MHHSAQYRTPEPPTPTEPTATTSRLRTITGDRFPRTRAICPRAIARSPGTCGAGGFGLP